MHTPSLATFLFPTLPLFFLAIFEERAVRSRGGKNRAFFFGNNPFLSHYPYLFYLYLHFRRARASLLLFIYERLWLSYARFMVWWKKENYPPGTPPPTRPQYKMALGRWRTAERGGWGVRWNGHEGEKKNDQTSD